MTLKNLIRTSAICAGALALCNTTLAVPINITMSLPHNGSSVLVNDVSLGAIGNNSPATLFQFLLSDIGTYNNNVPGDLPDPTTTLIDRPDLNGVGPVIPVEAGDYLVLHYGGSKGGGGVVALYFDAAGTYDIPDNGAGPNGTGGVSSARLWDHGTTRVPDGGTSVVLLGLALVGLEGVRRGLARK